MTIIINKQDEFPKSDYWTDLAKHCELAKPETDNSQGEKTATSNKITDKY